MNTPSQLILQSITDKKARLDKYIAKLEPLTCGTGEVLKRPVGKKPIIMRPLEAGKMRFCRPNPR